MKVITSPEKYEKNDYDICVFLAGGITNCPDWQKEVITELSSYPDTDKLVVFNPRRDNFPINDPSATETQIMWEFNWLEQADIFSMLFCDGPSDQPICMYEYGRNIVRMQNRFPSDWEDRIVTTVAQNYKRLADVTMQSTLASKNMLSVYTYYDNYSYYHANHIYGAYKDIVETCLWR